MVSFSINTASGTPIDRQFVDQIRELVAGGALSRGDRLPSVRAVAAELGVNPMAVSRAYAQLARDGLLENRHGEGTGWVVTDGTVDPADAMGRRLEELVDAARRLGLSREQLVAAVERTWEGAENAAASGR